MKRPLKPEDQTAALNVFGPLLGAVDIPDAQWAANPYALALSLWYRDRTGLDPCSGSQRDTPQAGRLKSLRRAVLRAFSRAAVVLIPAR